MSFSFNKRLTENSRTFVDAKPVLKWAGGKGQLLPTIRGKLLSCFGSAIRKYAEPCIGGGAVFFDLYNSGYSDVFDDSEQIRLAELFKQNDKKGITQMLSNSDPFTYNRDDFFEDLYRNFHINRVEASRMINSISSKRGKISELLITNYE